MWSPACILEQSRFQPAIVCKTRVLLIASTTVRFIGVAILWVPIASARVVRSTVLRGGGGASSALIAPAGLARAVIGVLDHGGDPCRWRHHSSRSPSFAFASLNFILKTINPCWAAGVPLRPAPTRRLRSRLLTPSTRCTTVVPTPMVRPIFTLRRPRSSIASGRTAFQIASSHRRLHAFSADHDRGGFRAVLLHNDEDLAPSG